MRELRRHTHRTIAVSGLFCAAVAALLLWVSPLYAAEITIQGKHTISGRLLELWAAECRDGDAAAIAEAVRERYCRNGYFDAQVVGMAGPEETVILSISEGPAITLGEVKYILPEGADKTLFPFATEERMRGIASAANIENGLQRLVTSFVDKGYPLVQVSPENFHREGNLLLLSVRIDPGPRVRVAGWRIVGLERTDTADVRRLLELSAGLAWDLSQQSRIEEKLASIEYLRLSGRIDIARYLNDSSVVIEIPLAESPAITADGGLGLTGNNTGDAAWRGRLTVMVDNPFGGGRQLDLLLSHPGEATRSRLRFSDPQLGHSRIGLYVTLEQEKAPPLYDRVTGSLGWSLRAGREIYARAAGSWSKITPLSDQNGIAPARKYDFPLSVGNRLPGSRGAVAFFWSSGLSASIRREFGVGGGHTAATVSRLRVNSSVRGLWSLRRDVRVRVAGHLASWLGPDTDLSWGDEIYLGGPESLRGYPERSFTTRGFALLSSEIGFYPTRAYGVFLFSDVAHYRPFSTASGRIVAEQVIGYGLGLETINYLGRTRLEVGWPEDGNIGDGVMYLRWLRGW